MRRRSAWGFMRESEFRVLVTLIRVSSTGYQLHAVLVIFRCLPVRQILLRHL